MKTTKSKKKFLALFLSVVLLIISIPVYAESGTENSGEHVFTFEELASMDSPQNPLLPDDGTFVPVNKVEGDTARTSGARATASTTTEYYIIEKADGYLLTSPSSGAFSRTRYSSGNGNGHNFQKWKIKSHNNNGIYIVYSATDDTKCLTVNPTTKAVTLTTYVVSQYQKWKMYYSGSGNVLVSMADDTSVNGYKLVIGASSCSVSNSTYTPVGFFQVEGYVPVTKLTYKNFWLAPQQIRYVEPTKTPSDADGGRGSWVNWSISPSNASPAVVSSEGKVTGGSPYKSAQLMFTDKITRVSGSCYITITEITNGTYFLKNKQNSQHARVKNDTLTNGQNVVQYSFDGDAPQRWIFTLNSNTGYYSIKSVQSGTTAYYMAVSDDASTVGKPIVIRSATESTLTDGMKWRIERTSSGAYKLCPKTGEANGYVLNTSTSATTNNKILTQDTYVQNTSYRDEWFFTKPEYQDYGLYTGIRVSNRRISIQTVGTMANSSEWLPLINASASSWSSANANISITNSTAAHKIFVGNYADSWYGLTYWPNGNNTSAVIKINARTCESNSANRKSTITHEMGHVFGLNDNPPVSSDKSLMNHSRNRESIYVPQPFDIMNVKYIYEET